MFNIPWEKYPIASSNEFARSWLEEVRDFNHSPSTIDSYARSVNDYLFFCIREELNPLFAKKIHILKYFQDLQQRPNPKGAKILQSHKGVGLATATMKRMLVAVRLFYDYLVEEGHCALNPVPRGRYNRGSYISAKRGLIKTSEKIPWIPTEEDWQKVLEVFKGEGIRNCCALSLQYDAALRRQELTGLEITDFDFAHRTVRVRAEISKNYKERIVTFHETTAELIALYLKHRNSLFGRQRGALFLSESPRNYGKPISIWTWSKIIRRIAVAAGLEYKFTTHTMRHLRLTDLARAGWSIIEIAKFAGHNDFDTTNKYIRLSCREIAGKYTEAMNKLHDRRIKELGTTIYDEN